jgi:hypothetical protein
MVHLVGVDSQIEVVARQMMRCVFEITHRAVSETQEPDALVARRFRDIIPADYCLEALP